MTIYADDDDCSDQFWSFLGFIEFSNSFSHRFYLTKDFQMQNEQRRNYDETKEVNDDKGNSAFEV